MMWLSPYRRAATWLIPGFQRFSLGSLETWAMGPRPAPTDIPPCGRALRSSFCGSRPFAYRERRRIDFVATALRQQTRSANAAVRREWQLAPGFLLDPYE